MSINTEPWNVVRNALGAKKGPQLYRRSETTVNELVDGVETPRTIVSYEPVQQVSDEQAKAAFARIEADVERMMQELNSYILSERELRNALEDGGPGVGELQRRG